MIAVHLATFLFALSLFFVGCVALGYGLGLTTVLAIQRHSRKDRLHAEEKGAALLRSWLSPEQAELWDSHRHFYVVGSDTGTRYRIRYGTAMNIDELDSGGRVIAQWCFGLSHDSAHHGTTLRRGKSQQSPPTAPTAPDRQ
jgi:hypothetical protein